MSKDKLQHYQNSVPVGERVSIFLRGTTWYANFQSGHAQVRKSLRTASKKEACRRALKIEAELTAGTWGEIAPPASLSAATAAYLDYLRAEDRAPKTLTKYSGILRAILKLAEERGVMDVAGIDLRFVDAYRRKRSQDEASPKTRYTETVIVRQFVNFALSRNMVASDPLKGLRIRKPKPTLQPCWTRQEVERILVASPTSVHPAFVLLADTGMRFGELAWLTWKDIELSANRLHIQPKEGWRPKSGDRRWLPLTERARQLLEILPRRWKWVVTMPPSKTQPVHGRQWTERRLLCELKKVLNELGLTGKLHTFRHTFISDALLNGIPVATVREWVGHVDSEVINLYTHVHEGASQAAMQRLGSHIQTLHQEVKNQKAGDGTSAQIQHTPMENENA